MWKRVDQNASFPLHTVITKRRKYAELRHCVNVMPRFEKRANIFNIHYGY